MGQRYGRMEDQKPRPGLHVTWILLKRKDLNLKLKRFPKLSKLGDVVSKLVQPKRITKGVWRPLLDDFLYFFFGKNSYFNAITIPFRTFLQPYVITKFLALESQLKKSNW